ncbi:MAG: hypothetical protein LBR26_16800 [Prevotella sp.]|jgi:hypothetical protein|nr:hypothetical protein [Prevotella sp.]
MAEDIRDTAETKTPESVETFEKKENKPFRNQTSNNPKAEAKKPDTEKLEAKKEDIKRDVKILSPSLLRKNRSLKYGNR